jgi:PAS domain-containing protein
MVDEGHRRDFRVTEGRGLLGSVNRHGTERKRADERLRESEHRLRLRDALRAAIYTTDAAGRITFYNPAVVELSGCRPCHLIRNLGRAPPFAAGNTVTNIARKCLVKPDTESSPHW